MKTESFILTLWITLALVFVFSTAALLENTTVSELRSNHATLIHQTQAIDRTKKRWSVEESKNDIAYLKQHQNLVKHEKRGGNLYFEFDNLSSNEFNTLSNKILNSMLVIKKITLKRTGESKGSIIVEIES
jgi:ABC-type molybdate transport system ATPase subunit